MDVHLTLEQQQNLTACDRRQEVPGKVDQFGSVESQTACNSQIAALDANQTASLAIAEMAAAWEVEQQYYHDQFLYADRLDVF